ncbi:Uncharacterized protein GBIM_11711 [Gryllus bimaculatus]|nr:Uncharacterized protein GBIM_11711 [Gryllus bimaculatus]
MVDSQRVCANVKTELSAPNQAKAINLCTTSVLTYSFGILKWTDPKLKNLDIKTRKEFCIARAQHSHSSIEWFRMPLVDGGKGIPSVTIRQHMKVRNHIDYFLQKTKSRKWMTAIIKKFSTASTDFHQCIVVVPDPITNFQPDFLHSHPTDQFGANPPWWNKYIRRKKSKCTEASYQMMYNDSLKNLPIAELLSPDALVAVWCTNSDQNINALLTEVFPDWGVKYLGTWIWLKVTNSGEPICAFADPPKKQPYERIIFGCNSEKSRCYNVPEDEKIIISVPSAIHSHKPPLSDVLSSYLPPEPNCLELFARYLLPNWTSWGNEVLKLQHISLFKENPSDLGAEWVITKEAEGAQVTEGEQGVGAKRGSGQREKAG